MIILSQWKYKTQLFSFYWPKGIRDLALALTQPDLINPVRYLTGLDANRMRAIMFQQDDIGNMDVACPCINAYRMKGIPVS